MTKIAETVCVHCGGNELRKTGIYYGKFKTTQRYQCKNCKSYFGLDISPKVEENQANAHSSNSKGDE